MLCFSPASLTLKSTHMPKLLLHFVIHLRSVSLLLWLEKTECESWCKLLMRFLCVPGFIQVKPVGSKDSQAAAASQIKEAASYSEISEAPVENSCDKSSIEKSAEDESLKQTESKDDKKDEFSISESSAVLDARLHPDSLTESTDILADESESTEVSKEVDNIEKTKLASCEGPSLETALPRLPKVKHLLIHKFKVH